MNFWHPERVLCGTRWWNVMIVTGHMSTEQDISSYIAVSSTHLYLQDAIKENTFFFFFSLLPFILTILLCFLYIYIYKRTFDFTFSHFLPQVRTFRGHANEKNFVGLTVNSEYIACGSETNEVFVYHKVRMKNIFSYSWHFSFWGLKIDMSFGGRLFRNQLLGTGLVQMQMKLTKMQDPTSLVLCVGKVIVQLC